MVTAPPRRPSPRRPSPRRSPPRRLSPIQTTGRRLSPLLDPAAVALIARQLWTVHNRLYKHTQGKLPSPFELTGALFLYKERSDAIRLEAAQHQLEQHESRLRRPRDAPSIRLLSRLLSISDATYCVSEHDLLVRALARLRLPPPVRTRAQAEKWKPGFVLVHDEVNSVLLLSIRGSREAGDLVTNLSSDCEPFLSGYAHQGVVNSARNLHAALRRVLARELMRRRPRHGLVIVGHSLGGAAGAALTMLLRGSPAPHDEPPAATMWLAAARCFSFSPPPFLCARLASRSRRMPIITVVYGLDVVPRLSAKSVDRLLQRVSAYDFSPHVSSAVGRFVRSVTTPVLGEREASSLAERAAAVRVDAGMLANVSGTLAQFADRALSSRASAGVGGITGGFGAGAGAGAVGAERGLDDGAVAGGMWGTAFNAVLLATKMVGKEVEGNAVRFVERQQGKRRSLDGVGDAGRGMGDRSRGLGDRGRGGSRGRHDSRGSAMRDGSRVRRSDEMTADEVDELLDDEPKDMLLAGEIWHVDRPFVDPTARVDVAKLPVPCLVRRDANYFKDIEMSAWMLEDHDPRTIGTDLNRM